MTIKGTQPRHCNWIVKTKELFTKCNSCAAFFSVSALFLWILFFERAPSDQLNGVHANERIVKGGIHANQATDVITYNRPQVAGVAGLDKIGQDSDADGSRVLFAVVNEVVQGRYLEAEKAFGSLNKKETLLVAAVDRLNGQGVLPLDYVPVGAPVQSLKHLSHFVCELLKPTEIIFIPYYFVFL